MWCTQVSVCKLDLDERTNQGKSSSEESFNENLFLEDLDALCTCSVDFPQMYLIYMKHWNWNYLMNDKEIWSGTQIFKEFVKQSKKATINDGLELRLNTFKRGSLKNDYYNHLYETNIPKLTIYNNWIIGQDFDFKI